jgi:saccharopine dehydrogenase-like NADP-dependent oxidoreductase
MCETYEGKADKLNYKTIRYPGHMKLMRFYFHELMMKNNRKQAGEILVNAFPPVSDDVVYVHAAVDGFKKGGKKELFKEEFVRAYYPKKIAGQEWRAISWTTACSICAVIELVSKGKLPQKGFIKQEDISLSEFLKTKNGSYYEK